MTIYTDTIAKLKSLLGEIPQVQEVFCSPLGINERISKYPAVILLPGANSVDFSDTAANHHTMRFRLWIVVSGNNTSNRTIFEEVLPKVVDAVISKIGTGWDLGTIGGHRTWVRVESGDWGSSVEDKSTEAWAEFSLIIRLDADI
jgi:hypothetical protein